MQIPFPQALNSQAHPENFFQINNQVHHIDDHNGASPVEGTVRWDAGKSIWIGSMTLIAIILGPLTFTWNAFAVFLVLTGLTLNLGHSLGMHRLLIHRAWKAPLWLEYFAVYLGTLVGMAGPIGMMRTHDHRDWAQRQARCHDYFGHRRGFWQDAWWQLHCHLELERPPVFTLDERIATSRFYRRLEATWMWQQLPVALVLGWFGGIGWIVWGVAVRVTVSVVGHWWVGHFAHREGHQSFSVAGASVQGYNVRVASWISMGEAWHNNHHAYPGSARIGLHSGEVDPGWWTLSLLQRLGLAWEIKLPQDLPIRPQVQTILI